MLLNKLCLTKSRSIAKIACDKGLVSLNGKTAKASAEVKEGDIIQFHLYG
ncbi:MAG TPA: S4 domain-containing protein, partial [Candidatus Syntrophosphaera thermopropionivorans]|nr:S4 domain-containing protein [Candidatus Syntrophosphaera thermopropionivorans]